MGEQVRAAGRFKTLYSNRDLYKVVEDVCMHANPNAPETVSQRAFNRTRPVADYADAPSAQRIATRLKTSWPVLLRQVFVSQRSIDRTMDAVERTPTGDHLTERHVFYALNRVAKLLEVDTLGPDAYADGRQKLLGIDRRRWRYGGVLEEVLPTVSQTLVLAGSWAKALEIAGLKPYRQPRERVGLPIPEAISLFIDMTGHLPTLDKLFAFGNAQQISLQSMKGLVWSEQLAAAKRHREEQGLANPTTYFPRDAELPAIEGEAAEEAARKRPVKEKGYWTVERCLKALVEYLGDLPPDQRGTQKHYLQQSVGRRDWPAPRHFARHGGFRKLITEAREQRLKQDRRVA